MVSPIFQQSYFYGLKLFLKGIMQRSQWWLSTSWLCYFLIILVMSMHINLSVSMHINLSYFQLVTGCMYCCFTYWTLKSVHSCVVLSILSVVVHEFWHGRFVPNQTAIGLKEMFSIHSHLWAACYLIRRRWQSIAGWKEDAKLPNFNDLQSVLISQNIYSSNPQAGFK